MNRKLLVTALLFLAAWSTAWADRATESAQQKLKDGGFYYGEINGKKDADTTAAIRRYQIRNGLQITGELNTETQRALGLTSKPASTPAPRPAQTPGPTPPGFLEETPAPTSTPVPRSAPPEESELEEAPAPPRQPRVESAGALEETPYAGAPPQIQQDIVTRAQIILMREGFCSHRNRRRRAWTGDEFRAPELPSAVRPQAQRPARRGNISGAQPASGTTTDHRLPPIPSLVFCRACDSVPATSGSTFRADSQRRPFSRCPQGDAYRRGYGLGVSNSTD